MSSIKSSLSRVSLPTYALGEAERNPMFFEKRVYQGSNGSVYPLPFIDKVFDEPVDQEYQVAKLENEYVYLEMLPEIGGRIFKGQDKTNQNYDFFYRQDVIKPALVGLAGPWISGGVEFNWPQHHRPGTFLPSDTWIENESDGAVTVWMSEIDPLTRMKGMHGVRLRPGSSLIELRVRLFNRTPVTQTFLWWANVAAKVHDQYQSFFPPDVHYVADHAVRAMTEFPESKGAYYGVNYGERWEANDLRWYRNIPVPTSYMVCETQGSFFGGYDYDAQGGFVHVANKHIAPGKKQWTWGNHDFGWAWDRELTDKGGPYVELMAGVYTDNQPDFSYLHPYETKTFSQYWWPIQKTGPVQEANLKTAVRMVPQEGRERLLDCAVLVSEPMDSVMIRITENDDELWSSQENLDPGSPWVNKQLMFHGEQIEALKISVFSNDGKSLIEYSPAPEIEASKRQRSLAQEISKPEPGDSVEELILAAEHLEQYRHPTRDSKNYYLEALKKDKGNYKANLGLGKLYLNSGNIEEAARYFETARKRLTLHHPNPSDGEAWYYGGVCSKYLGQLDSAYTEFYKATWNYEWRSSSYYQLACIDCERGEFSTALEHVQQALQTNSLNSNAGVLKAICLRELQRNSEAVEVLQRILRDDPLHAWAEFELSLQIGKTSGSIVTRIGNRSINAIEVTMDYIAAGQWKQAIQVLQWHLGTPATPVAVPIPVEPSPMITYFLAWLYEKMGEQELSGQYLKEAVEQSSDYFFPNRIEEMLILEWARKTAPNDAILYALGNYYFSKKRHFLAIERWEAAVSQNSSIAQVYRNLGIAYWNTSRDQIKAKKNYETALALSPEDARIVFEYDQLRKKCGDPIKERLAFLNDRFDQVLSRDDCCIEWAVLMNDLRKHREVLDLLLERRFHPWEGGEGKVLREYTRAKIGIGRELLTQGNADAALLQFEGAFKTPQNLGEAYHLHQAKADVNFWRGMALQNLGKTDAARSAFDSAIKEQNDFQGMEVVPFSPISYFKGLALFATGKHREAEAFFSDMTNWVQAELKTPAAIDYFATSLPNLLVFEEDIQQTRDSELRLLLKLSETSSECLNDIPSIHYL